MIYRNLLTILFLLLLSFSPCLAAEQTTTEAPPVEEAEAATFPGLSELGPRSSALIDFMTKSEEQLKQLAETAKLEETLSGIAEQSQKILAEIEPLGPPDDWYVDRLSLYIGQFNLVRQGLENLQSQLTTRQQEVEEIHAQTQQEKEFWSAWADELKKQDVKLPKQTLDQLRQLLRNLENSLKKTSSKLLHLQESAGALQRDSIATGDNLNLALGQLRKATFRKNAHSLLSSKFYQQFQDPLWAQLKAGLTTALHIDLNYLRDHSWRLGLMAISLMLMTGLIGRYRSQLQMTDNWLFVLNHPLAAGTFIAVVIFGFWFPAPPPFFRFGMRICAVVAATTLAASLLPSRRQAWVLSLAALVFLVTSTFRIIALPQPLFRLYIALMALILIPLLIQQIRLSILTRRERGGKFYRALMRLAIVVLSISFIGQITGFMNFSTWLLQATFDTGMIILFSQMAIRLTGGGIDFLIQLMCRSGHSFFVRFGDDLALRLKRLLNLFLILLALLYLLPVWRLFSTIHEGWTYIRELSFSIGEVNISLQMLVMALLAFYLAMQTSWFLQGMCETQIFSRRSLDRGVRDAIKKLIHYGIVLVGFLTALSILGMGLQNFVVVLGAFGVGIGFGLQDIVNNFLSGLILLFERPIKVGDAVLIDGEYGIVTRIGLRSTVVENLDQAELIVPNSHMISQKVTNWTLTTRRVRIVVPVGVAYGSDLETVLGILTDIGVQHSEILEEPKPFPLFIQFGASSLDFELRVWISNVDNRHRIKNELLLHIDRRFREAGIEIPFPQRDLHLRSVAAEIKLPGISDPDL